MKFQYLILFLTCTLLVGSVCAGENPKRPKLNFYRTPEECKNGMQTWLNTSSFCTVNGDSPVQQHAEEQAKLIPGRIRKCVNNFNTRVTNEAYLTHDGLQKEIYPLEYLALYCHGKKTEKVATMLLQNNADPNKKATSFKFPISLLDYAVKNNNVGVTKAILESDAVPDKWFYGSVIYRFVEGLREDTTNFRLMDLLIDQKANVNGQNVGGETALHIAYRKKLPQVFHHLQKLGADWNIKNRAGYTAKANVLLRYKQEQLDFQQHLMALEERDEDLYAGTGSELSKYLPQDVGNLVQDKLEREKDDKDKLSKILPSGGNGAEAEAEAEAEPEVGAEQM